MYANNLDDAFSVFASGTTEEWVKSDKYMDYPKYHDEDYTYIEGRTIGDIAAQISVQGEAYSQYISFMMDRYYDGIDLIGMSIWIHYELKDGIGSEDSPVNVMYNDSTIRFGWVIPEKATQQSGDIKIGVWVNGTAPNTKAYILKTEEKIYTIHSGLIPGSGITQPDQNWFENFVEQMDSKVSTAQGYANDAQASKTAAASSATASAQSATASAKALEDNKAYVESQKETFVGYNKRETDLKYANALIGFASGTTQVTVDDAWEAPIPGMEIAGKSEQFSTTGAQLLDLSAVSKSAGGAVINTADGGYQISGTGALTEAFSASYQLDYLKNHLKPGNLILKSELTMPKLYVRIWDGSTVLAEMQGNSTKQITQEMINNENMRVECFLYGSAGSIITPGTYHPMLYQDGDGTWEPYTGGRPSPSPEYPQEIVSTDVTAVTVTGGDLFDTSALKGSKGVSWTVSSDKRQITVTGNERYATAYYIVPVQLIAGKTVTISCNISKGNPDVRVSAQIELTQPDGKQQYLSLSSSGSRKSSIPEDIVTARFNLIANNSNAVLDTPNTVTFTDVMLNIGDTALPWEPYRSKTAAITLTEPLRGIGDVRDRIMCRDGVWGIERKLINHVLTGEENGNWGSTVNGTWLFMANDKLKSEVPDYSTNYLCNYFVAGNARTKTDIIGSYIFNNAIRFRVDSSIASTEGDFKKWLASRYEANEPVRLIYPLAVPTWEPLPSDTQAALNALTAYKGRTTITVTAEGPEPDVAVEYVQDTRMVIADLQAQINAIRNGGTT